MNILRLTLLLFILAFSISANAANSNVRDLESAALCKAAIKNTNLDNINDFANSEIAKVCNDLPLNKELSIQMLSLMIGEPMFYMLEVSQALGLGWHTSNKSDNIFNIMRPVHDMFSAFNWLMFSLIFFLFSLIFFIQLVRWARSEEKQGFMKWLNRNFTQNGIAMAMSLPVMGWMTPIQIIAALFIIVIVFATKIVATIFFAGLFMADTAGGILSDSTPQIEAEMINTVMMYRCDILRREDLINGLITVNNYTERTQLEANPVFQCLQGSGQTLVNRTNTVNGSTLYTADLATFSNYESCLNDNRAYIQQHKLTPIDDCGYVEISVPNAGGSDEMIKERTSAVFLNSTVHNALRQIAMTIHEYSCRFRKTHESNQFGVFNASCAAMNMQNSSYSLNWVTDPVTSKEVIARHITPLNDTAKNAMRSQIERSKSEAINTITENQEALVNLLRSIMSTQNTPGGLPTDERDLDNLINKMGKGAWMTSSIFIDDTAKHIDNQKLTDAISNLYKAYQVGMTTILARGLSTQDQQWLLIEDLEPLLGQSYFMQKVFTDEAVSYTQSLILGAILPDFGLYDDQLSCWKEQSQCQASVLNPFKNLTKTGIGIFEHALIGKAATSALSKFSNNIFKFTGVRTKIMAVSVLDDFFMLYLVIAVMLVLIIPMYPLLKILSLFTQWSLEVAKELVGLQLSLAFSPISEPGKRVVTNDMRSALSRLVALGLYFLFIVLGIMVMFTAFTFLFSLNVLLLGGLSVIVNFTNGSHFLESVFMGVIFDVLVVVLLFLEVKVCSDLIDKVPGALAERFSLELSNGENISERVITTFRTHVMPGVSNFMSHLK